MNSTKVHIRTSIRKIAARCFSKISLSLSLLVALIILVPTFAQPAVETGRAAQLANVKIACKPFTQVNDSAFGMGAGVYTNYTSEEGFEAAVFNGQLYLGMEADNSYGARIWRSKTGVAIPASQSDWEEIAADEAGLPFGLQDVVEADHIDSLASFNGYIYASTANRSSTTYGTRVFRNLSGNPGQWEDATAAYGPGFGSVNNVNFKDMQVFQGYLCGGTQNHESGAQVWCTQDGTTWTQKNVSGFGQSTPDPRGVQVWSGYVFNGALYFGVQNKGMLLSNTTDDLGKLYRTSDLEGNPTWKEVFSGEPGSKRIDLLGELDGYLYISARGPEGVRIFRSPSGDPGSWSQVNVAGMDGNPNNLGVEVDSAVSYNGALYVGVSNTTSGFELWRTTGAVQGESAQVDWERLDTVGLGDTDNVRAHLISYNGYLYAWATNYKTGQQALQSECGFEETVTVSQTGVEYSFDPQIGATINFHNLGTASQVTVRSYPGAWDSHGLVVNDVVPVKRHYTIVVDGSGYNTDLTLAYNQSEFDESNIIDETTTYQAIWAGEDWQACPLSHQERDPEANTVFCSRVTDLSTVTIAGGITPTAIVLTDFTASGKNSAFLLIWPAIAASLLGYLMLRSRRPQAWQNNP